MLAKLINPILNLIPTIVRFFLTFVVAKRLSVSFFGSYSLVVTIIGLAVSFLAFEFYLHTTKSIVGNGNKYVNPTLNQLIFHIILSVVVFPLILFPIKYFVDLSIFQIVALFLVILSELLGRVLERTMFAINKTTYAYLVGAIKSGIWPIVLIWLVYSNQLNTFSGFINVLFFLWILGNISQIVILGIYLFKSKPIKDFKVDYEWIKKGLVVSLPLFFSTFGLQFMLNSGRFIIDIYGTKADVGIYSFYFQLANVFNLVINAGVLTIVYPKIIGIATKCDTKKDFKEVIKKTQIEILVFTLLSFVFGYLLLDTFLSVIDKVEFISNVNYFYYMIIGMTFIASSNIFYYILFGLNKAKEIVISTIISLFSSIVISLVLVQFYQLDGIIYSFIISGIILYSVRFFYFNKDEEKAISNV